MLGFLGSEIDEREANFVATMSLKSDGCLDRDRIGVESHEAGKKRVVALLHFARFDELSIEAERDEVDHYCGNQVRGHADEADSATRHEGESERIVAGEDLEILGDGLHELMDALDRYAGFFVGGDILANISMESDGVDYNLDRRAARDGGEHNGQNGVFGNCLVVLIEALL